MTARRRFLAAIAAILPAAALHAPAASSAPVQTSDAYNVLAAALRACPSYAWSWHCAVACCAMDEGLDHAASNRAAARFMRMAFGCDTSTPTTHRQSSRRLLLDDENYAYIDDAGIRWVYKFRPGERQAMLDAGMFDATTKA